MALNLKGAALGPRGSEGGARWGQGDAENIFKKFFLTSGAEIPEQKLRENNSKPTIHRSSGESQKNGMGPDAPPFGP